VGDEAFQRKCYNYFDELKLKGKTVVLVTHDMNAVQRFCTRAIVLDGGKIIYDGDTTSAAGFYRGLNLTSTEKMIKNKNKKRTSEKLTTSLELSTSDEKGDEQLVFKAKDPIIINCKVTTKHLDVPLQLDIKFNNPGGVTLSDKQIDLSKEELQAHLEKGKALTVKWKLPGTYDDGEFLISALLKNAETGEVYVNHEEAYQFSIQGWDRPGVLVHPRDSYAIELN
jgi:ABC-type multidrug transport system ATPase subunit